MKGEGRGACASRLKTEFSARASPTAAGSLTLRSCSTSHRSWSTPPAGAWPAPPPEAEGPEAGPSEEAAAPADDAGSDDADSEGRGPPEGPAAAAASAAAFAPAASAALAPFSYQDTKGSHIVRSMDFLTRRQTKCTSSSAFLSKSPNMPLDRLLPSALKKRRLVFKCSMVSWQEVAAITLLRGRRGETKTSDV